MECWPRHWCCSSRRSWGTISLYLDVLGKENDFSSLRGANALSRAADPSPAALRASASPRFRGARRNFWTLALERHDWRRPPLFDAWLVAISPLFRSCRARSRGNSCLMAPMLLS
jgi:hypothetical protein